MIRFIGALCSTDSLPMAGGAAAAVGGQSLINAIPPVEALISTIILASLGATVGYVIKLLLDYLILRKKKKHNKVETR